jgi:serine/threonine protein kinase
MPLSAGDQLGPYEILCALGAGGMGEVYRARDARLGREVAIKVLPAAFSQDAGRMARFEREAQVLASLNHPNIAAIYGIEQDAIVMELVVGEDLRGPVAVDAAIEIARQIAAGLEAAHEKGIVHRDLKPANIKVTPEGTVKLLDFGLAKATEESSVSAAAATQSPTLSMAMTQAGMILGTAAYMSPEQARGKPVDRRADIWAFGVVLYELLTGATLFGGGETVSDSLAAVITKHPDWTTLPRETPAYLRRLLERCLRKDPKLRLRDIGEARIALQEGEVALEPVAMVPATPQRHWLPWLLAAVGLSAGIASLVVATTRSSPHDAVKIIFPLTMPEGITEWGGPSNPNAVPSPDGRSIVFVGRSGDQKMSLWVRPMASSTAHRLDKTEEAFLPFWSPDSRFIGYFAENKLKKIPAAGGSPVTLCNITGDSQSDPYGGTWNASGEIVFSTGLGSPLMRVPAGGGAAVPVTTLDQTVGEVGHGWPQFLPDGRHLLYYAANRDSAKRATYVQELGSSARTLIMHNPLRAEWSQPGCLLFNRDGALFAQRMDPKKYQLTGEPELVVDEVNSNASSRAAHSVSGNVLVYRRGSTTRSGPLTWYARDGKLLGVVGKPGEFRSVLLAPDEKSVAADIAIGDRTDVWIMDLGTGVLGRMTNDGGNYAAAWSPDSRRLAINKANEGVLVLDVASGRTMPIGKGLYAIDWSPDNRWILCGDAGSERLLAVMPDGSAQPRTLAEMNGARSSFRLSPDGKLVTYTAGPRPSQHVFVASFPSFAEKRQISQDVGTQPIWRKDGREIFFRSKDGAVMSVEIKSGSRIEAGLPKALFTYGAGLVGVTFSPAADGKRFLVKDSESDTQKIMIVVNWAAELKMFQ